MPKTSQLFQSTDNFDAAILDALYEHIAVLDPSGNIIFVNQAWKKFADINDYRGANYTLGENYFSKITDSEVKKSIREVLDGTLSYYAYEYPCHSPEEKRWFWLYVTPVFNSQSQIEGIVTSHINMTERKLAELRVEALQEQLLQSERNRVLAETAGAAAHEINQPLTAVVGLAELLTRHTHLPADVIEDLKVILHNSQHINTIIQKMQQAETYVSKPYVGKTSIVDFDASKDTDN